MELPSVSRITDSPATFFGASRNAMSAIMRGLPVAEKSVPEMIEQNAFPP
jgi:hypothetical protein